jgi:hypothetical protein
MDMQTSRKVRSPHAAVRDMAPGSSALKTCAVPRCPNRGSVIVDVGQDQAAGSQELSVCAEHKALMDSGAPWDIEGRSVVIGLDMAPAVTGWRARPGAGADGFTLSLEIAGQPEPIHVFLRPDQARALAAFITAANGEG